MGVLVAAPAGATAQQNLGTKAASLLPATPGKTGFAVTVQRQAFATTTTLTSSQNPSQVGQAVTFTAQVTPTNTTILPTGSVVFRDGTTQLGSVVLEGAAQASFTTSSLTAGTHNITAEYQPGNAAASFATSTSAILAQTVNARPTPSPSPTVTVTKKPMDHKKEEEKKSDSSKPKDDWENKDDWEHQEEHADHHDHDDEHVVRLCKQFKNEDDFRKHDGGHYSNKEWQAIREACSKWWKDDEDYFTVIEKANRAHVEGDFEKGGGGKDYYEDKKHWYPEEEYEKPHYYEKEKEEKEKKHYEKPKPVVKQFAVTG